MELMEFLKTKFLKTNSKQEKKEKEKIPYKIYRISRMFFRLIDSIRLFGFFFTENSFHFFQT